MKRISRAALSLLLALVLLVSVLALSACGREEKFDDALKIGTLDLPKNLNPFAASSGSSGFFVEMFYDTLLGVDLTPKEAKDNPDFRFEDGTAYTPIDTDENPLAFTDNLLKAEGALKKREGSKYGYEYFDPTYEQWTKQLEKKSIIFGQDELGNDINETEDDFNARALSEVSNVNWMRFTFEISPGYTWNDGVPFSANDIVFTFDYIQKHAGALGSFAFFLSDYYESYVDENGDFVFVLAGNNYSDMKTICTALVILPEHIWKDIKSPASEKNLSVVGTGPYYVAEGDYIADSTITLTYRDDYSEILKQKEFKYQPIKHIVVELMSNEDVLINALQKGDVDLMLDTVKPSKAYAIKSSPSYDKVKISSVRNDFVTTLLFNVGEYGAFNESRLQGHSKQIRQAISLCISQEDLISGALYGMGVRVGDGLVQDYYDHAYRVNGEYVYHVTNVELANQILDETPYKMGENGRGLSFSVYAMPSNEVVVKSLATQLKQIGIELNYEQATSTYADVIKQSNHASFDMIINSVTFTADKLLMYDARYGVYDDGSPRVYNYSGIKDPVLSEMMKEMEKTADTVKQYELCAEVQKYLAEMYLEIPLYAEDKITFYSDSRFTGWVEAEGASIWNDYTIRFLRLK